MQRQAEGGVRRPRAIVLIFCAVTDGPLMSVPVRRLLSDVGLLVDPPQTDGLQRLADALRDPQGRVQRKGAQLAVYTLGDRPALAAASAVCDPNSGAAAAIPALLGSGERPVREAALALATVLARHPASAAALQEVSTHQAELQRVSSKLHSCSEFVHCSAGRHLPR